MLRRIFLPTIFFVLGYGFWASPNFKEITAGVAIFLFGMLSLEEGFRSFTGDELERILRKTTDRLWKSMSFGIISTTLMQSSTLVSVITISFLSAGLLGLKEGIGIIFGANLGTTTGAWIIAGFGLKVNISSYAMPMLVFGIILVFQKSKGLKGAGYILAGLGFLFLGTHHMKLGFEAFKATINLAEYAIPDFPGLIVFTAIGIFATVVMQSSHATLVLIITALAAGQITYENALALAIGANIGTTITALIGSMSANEQGKRLAGAHLVFNLVTGLIAIALIHQFMWLVDTVSDLVGIRETDYPLKLAVFHTSFNLVGIIVLVPFIDPLARFLNRIITDRVRKVAEPKYLVSATVDYPETAVEAVRKETEHIYINAFNILAGGLCFEAEDIRSDRDLKKIASTQRFADKIDIDAAYKRNVKSIYGDVIAFISKATFSWKEEHSADLHWLRDANRNIAEAVKGVKHLQKNLVKYIISDNVAIRKEYNELRIRIAEIMRELEKIRKAEGKNVTILSLDPLKLSLEEHEEQLLHRMYELIHGSQILPEMGISLMNDSGYAYDISKNLIEMGSTLFVRGERGLTNAERSIALDDDELAEVLQKGKSPDSSLRGRH